MEDLKMILETVSTLGDKGLEGFIWYLLLDKVFPGIVWLITLTLLCKVLVKPILSHMIGESTGEKIRDILFTNTSGWFTPSEKRMVVEEVKRLKEKANGK